MIKRPKGTFDIYGMDAKLWKQMEETIHHVCYSFGAEEIRTPIFEFTDLFVRGVGDTTDIVQKEMYTFSDRADRSFTLRPELTASVMRAYDENGLHNLHKPQKLYYIGPIFRAETPQKGRQRQFTQMGIEYLGVDSPEADGEVISIAYMLLKKIGIEGATIRINSIGSPASRKEFYTHIQEHVEKTEGFCKFCKERAYTNPLRVIDCKNEECQSLLIGTKNMLDFLNKEDTIHFEEVKKYLDRMHIPYIVDPKIVRGLDYYVKTVFEIHVDSIGAQSALGGGGRYDGLLKSIGSSKDTPGVGFALGLERFVLALQAQGKWVDEKEENSLFVAFIGEKAKEKAEEIVFALRQADIPAEIDLLNRNLRGQMKYADKLGMTYSMVLGEDEIEKEKAIIKHMQTGEEKEIAFSNIHQFMEGK